jgi:hypothetical protein
VSPLLFMAVILAQAGLTVFAMRLAENLLWQSGWAHIYAAVIFPGCILGFLAADWFLFPLMGLS